MTTLTETPVLSEVTEQRMLWVPPRPLTFDEYLDLFGPKDDVELIDGVVQRRMAVQLDHELLFVWLITLLNTYAAEKDLGHVLGSRTPVQINRYRGRMPDILFLRKGRLRTTDQRAIRVAPDLVVELVSPGDRPSHLIALETDYRSIGVSEVIFINQQRQTVRVLRKGEGSAYAEASLGPGESLRLETMQGIALNTDWLLTDARPTIPDALALLNTPG
jgi:Uma2 family endonuclease